MQIVIDISEDDLDAIKFLKVKGWASRHELLILNGTPLNEVLDKIRAEITNIPITDSDGHYNNWYREPQAILNEVFEIIDKYRNENI